MHCYGKESPQIRARVGESFCVELQGMPSSGYVWSLADRPGALQVVEEALQPGGSVGGAARHRFVFQPVAAGSARLVFEYGRPWESKAHERVEIPVQIED